MNIVEFLESFNKAEDKNAFVREHIVVSYLPYEKKMGLCKNIIDSADYTPNLEVIDKKYYSPNASMRFLFFSMSIVNTYTDIELDKIDEKRNDVIGGFNKLDENGVFEILFQELGKEYSKMKLILAMMVEDVNNKENSLVGFLSTKFDAFETLYNTALPIIENKIVNFPKQEG